MGFPRPPSKPSAAQQTNNTVYNKQYQGGSKKEAEKIAQQTGVPLGTVRTGAGKGTRTQYVVGISASSDPVGHAFMSVNGRMPNAKERASYQQFVKTGRKGRDETNHSSLRMHVAANYNVRDKAKWGVTAADPNKLKGDMKDRYDLWRRYNPGKEFTTATQQYLGWSLNGGRSDVTFEASQRGLIRTELHKNEDGSYTAFDFISPQATAFAASRGDKIFINGTQRGRLYYGDLGNVRSSNLHFRGDADKSGMYTAQGKGRPKKGLIGGEVGKFFTEVVSDQLKFIMDPLGMVGSLVFGQKFGEGAQIGGAKLTGASREDIGRAQQIGQQVLSTALAFVPGIGFALSAGAQYVGKMSAATTAGMSRTEAFNEASKGVLASAFAAGISAGFNNAAMSTEAYARGYASAASQGASKFAAHAQGIRAATSGLTRLTQGAISSAVGGAVGGLVREGDWRAAAEGALVGAAGSVVSAGITAGMGSISQSFADSAAGQAIGYQASSPIASAFNSAVASGVSGYVGEALRYGISSQAREDLRKAIAQGDVKDKDEALMRSALSQAAIGGLGGYMQGRQFQIEEKEFREAIANRPLPELTGDFEKDSQATNKFFAGVSYKKPEFAGIGALLDPREEGLFAGFGFAERPDRYKPVYSLGNSGSISDYLSDRAPTSAPLPTFKQVLFGEDEKFQWSDVFGATSKTDSFAGITEGFVRAAGATLLGSFGAGILDPRIGPAGGTAPKPRPQQTFSGGPTYGGYIQQSYAGGSPSGEQGPAPVGSEVVAEMAGGF